MKKMAILCGMAAMMLSPVAVWAALATDDPLGNALVVEENGMSDHMPEYWLGIELRLDSNDILVQQVVPDSPAAKAGVAPGDVIQKVDGKPISVLGDMLKAVDTAKDKEMTLDILRDGQSKTIAVTPAKRPERIRLANPPAVSDFEGLRRWIEQLQQGGNFGQGPMQFRFMRPGVILPRGAPVHPPLPGNMSITITKSGDKPADIVVKQGDEKWEVNEKELDKLPEKIRPYVDSMLGMAAGAGSVRWIPEITVPPEPGPVPNPPPANVLEKRLERRLDELKQHIDRLENELHMRHQVPAPSPPAPPPEKPKEEPQGKTAL
jgi:membrane-associated protease RseP (regulator of RpoE activity)